MTDDSDRRGPRNPYLKCIEYACIVDLVLKIISIFSPSDSFVKNHRTYLGPQCHWLYYISVILSTGAKVYSVMISVIGIRAAWFHSLPLLITFLNHLIYYCFVELFSLLYFCSAILFSNCSNLLFSSKLIQMTILLILGLIVLAVYYLVWRHFIDKAIAGLQNGEYGNFSDDMPRSFVGYDTLPTKEDGNEPKKEATTENEPLKGQNIEIQSPKKGSVEEGEGKERRPKEKKDDLVVFPRNTKNNQES